VHVANAIVPGQPDQVPKMDPGAMGRFDWSLVQGSMVNRNYFRIRWHMNWAIRVGSLPTVPRNQAFSLPRD